VQLELARHLVLLRIMRNASTRRGHLHWELLACGPRGEGPFLLVLDFANACITEYFQDVATAVRAIEDAERGPADPLVPDRPMIKFADDTDLVKQCFREETWAGGARH